MQIAETKSEAATKSRNRSTRVELSLRREQVYILLAKRYKARRIHLKLKKRFPNITINKVYDDIQHVKRHPEGYRILEYVPNIREQCEWGRRQIDSAIRGAFDMYYKGT
jgi:Fe2+ or Zn2+ uptake regulation protein